jgi:uncharacterized membrane protein
MKLFLNRYFVLLLIIIACVPLLGLLQPGLPVTHDGQDHVARIANFYQSLSEGNPVPRWAANLNWGYGHPILMFLYPLPSYVASLFHVIGFSFVDSTKLVFGISYILSALTMYLWIQSVYGKKAGLISALLYTFTPYRFIDLYVRGAIGEHVAFIFPPLIAYFFYKMTKPDPKGRLADRNLIGASLSVAALILSHNAMAIMFLPIIIIYIGYLLAFEVKQKSLFILQCFGSLVIGFGMSSFFWIPAYFEGKYTLRDVVTVGVTMERFVPWQRFLYPSWNYGAGDQVTQGLGFIQWFGILISIIYMKLTKDKRIRTMLTGVLILLLASLFIMTPWSSFLWNRITLLQKFQFPWRFLSVTVFCIAVFGGIGISSLLTRFKPSIRNTLLFVYCLLLIISTVGMWHTRTYQVKDESFYTGIFSGTTDTGESSPVWSVRFMEHKPIANIEVVDGVADITNIYRNTTKHVYSVNAHKKTLMMENTVYFPGWLITIDGKPVQIQYQNMNYRGLMMFDVPEGKHTVEVMFTNTRLRQVSELISLFTFIMLVAAGLGTFLWKRKK